MGVTLTSSSTTTLTSRHNTEVSIVQRILWICNTFYYQILALVSALLLWTFFDQESVGGSSFKLHLILSTSAYVPLMAAAIILFSEDNLTTLYIPRTKRYTIHSILLSISCVFVSIGIGVETHAKGSSRPHFKSNHAIFGLASWILVFVSMVVGIMAANTRTFSNFIKPVLSKLIHNVVGLAAFVLGIMSTWEMLHHVQSALSHSAFIGLKIGVVFVTVWSSLAAIKSLFGQIKGVFS